MTNMSTKDGHPLPGIRVRSSTIPCEALVELRSTTLLIDQAEWSAFYEELRSETDRGAAILVAAWADELLKRRLQLLFCHGPKGRLADLFDNNGPFQSFGAKISAAECLGWLDAEIAYDVRLIKSIRNGFAHQFHGLTIHDAKVSKYIEKFKTPSRVFHDWNDIRAAANNSGDGFIMFTGTAPGDTGDTLSLSGIKFRLASSLIITYLAAALKVNIMSTDEVLEQSPNQEP